MASRMTRLTKFFVDEPYHAWPIVTYLACVGWLFGRYQLQIKNMNREEHNKYRDEYTVIRYEALKNPDKPYFN